MASEVLNKIRDAEDEAQAIVNIAAIAGRETVLKANQEAEKLIVDANQKAKEKQMLF